jgi:hypothetical protein
MRTHPRTVCCMIAVACTPWSAVSAQSPGQRPLDGVKAGAIDACSVLTRDEIKKLTGQDPGAPRPSGSGDTTICYWEAASPSGSITLHALAGENYQSMSASLKAMTQRGQKARMVKVLGEEAIFREESDGIPSGTLFVKTDRYVLSIWRQAGPKATAASVLPTLVALAGAAIPKLR